MKACKKIVLAYSGGLDTTVAIPWLKEKTGAHVVALCVDVGQSDDLPAAKEKALAAGALEAYIVDARERFVHHCIAPAIKANALYEGAYPLLSALSRPVIAEELVKLARASNADAVAHGCTGKGNDQIRFELSLAALAPDLVRLAPARHWGFTRKDSLAYARAHNIPCATGNASPYSIDENLWGRAIECGDIEDAWLEAPDDAFAITSDVEAAPDEPKMMTVDFEAGLPVAINGTAANLTEIIETANHVAGAGGVGRIDHVESRVVGMKSRELYECPAALSLIEAHKALEAMVLTRDELAFKAGVDAQWADVVYEGKWHSPLLADLDAFIDATQQKVFGTVRLKLFKGSLSIAGRRSPCSLYDPDVATYGADDPFDHAASEGFVKILSMETVAVAEAAQKKSQKAQVKSHGEIHMAQPV